MSRSTQRALLAGALAALALLAGCSLTRIAYNHADWLIVERVDDYVSLSEDQRGTLAVALSGRLEDHRRATLPGIAEWLDRSAEALRGGAEQEDIRRLAASAEALVVESLRPVVPELAAVLAELSPRQRAFMRDRLEAWQREAARRHRLDAAPAQRLEKRIERSIDRIEDITGPLAAAQRALVARYHAQMPDTIPEWLAYAERRNAQLLGHLERGAGREAIEAVLSQRFLLREDMPDALRERWARKVELWVALVHDLAATLDREQRRRAVGYIERLRDDALALSGLSS